MTRPSKQTQRENGMVLVIVLWFVSCIALLVASFNATVWSATTVIRDEISTSRTATVLDAGVALAAFRISAVGDNRWLADGSEHLEVIDGVPIEIRIVDESGKIDLNSAKPELLTPFLQQFVTTPREALDLTEEIIKVRERAGVADPTGRTADGPPIATQNTQDQTRADEKRAFMHITQLLDLPGVTYSLYRKLEPFITVYNRRGRINTNTAAREVMLSLPDLTPVEVDRLIASRGLPNDEPPSAGESSDSGENIKSEKAGPAYSVIVKQAAVAGAAGMESRVTILVGPKFKEQYHVLAWQLQSR